MTDQWISINQGFQIIGGILAIIVLLMIIAFRKPSGVKKTPKK